MVNRERTVAVSDDQVRILDIARQVQNYPWRRGNGKSGFIADPVSDYFRPDENGNIRTEEEIIKEIESGKVSRSNYIEDPGYVGERKDIKDLDTKKRILLEALLKRSEANMQNGNGGRGAGNRFMDLKKAFDPDTYTPGENLADRFNALTQKLAAPSK